MSIELVVTESMIDGAVLKYMRRVKRLRQEDISNVLKISTSQYSRYESGHCESPIKAIRTVSKLTGNDVLDFCKHVHRVAERLRVTGVTILDTTEEAFLSQKILLNERTLRTFVMEMANEQ